MPTDPSGLSGKALWLRAKDLSSGSVTTWPNAAAVASDATSAGTAPTVAASSTPNSGKSVLFAGAGNFALPPIGGRGAATASSIFAAGYEAPNACDGTTANNWASSTLPATWTIELADAETLTAYRIYPSSNSGQQPAAWTFEGSNNGSSWTTLDTRSSQSPTGGAWNSYSFSNSTAYKVYRFVFTASTGSSIVNIHEFDFGGVANSTTQTAEVWAVVQSAGSGAFQGIWHLGGTGGTGASYYPYSGGSTVYEGAFLDDAIGTNYTHSMSINTWRLYRVANNGTTWQAWIDGTSQLTRSSQPATYDDVPLLGKNRAGYFFNGNIAEILVRRTISTSGEVADLISYFNAEHGMSVPGGALAFTTPALSVAVSAPAPTLVSALILSPPAATANVSAPAPTLTLGSYVVPVATVAVSAPIPTLTIPGGPVTYSPPAATVTVSAPAPTFTVAGALMSWTSDLSQQAVAEFTSLSAILYVEPPAAAAPATIVERTILRNSIMLDPMTVDTDTGRVDPASFDATITGEVGVYHVTVDGIDVTYWRDAPTVIGQLRFSEPGGEDSARLEFPQITSIDEAGTGDLAWLHTDAPVEIFILTPDDDRIHKFSGHLVSDNTGIGTALQSSWDVQGNIRQGDNIVHRVPTILDRTDIGTLVPQYLNGVPGRRYASIPPTTTGITSKQRGSYSDTEWDYSQNLLGGAYELDGDQWTLTRSGINQYGIALKDRDTVHWTVTAGTPGIEFDLTEDVANLVNCIYGRGVGPDGYAWAGWCHPNLLPDDAPDYPMFPITDLIEVGTDDADTTTGEGVTTWQRRVQSLGYSITVDGVYSSADALVCRQVQTDYGLLVDGKVGPQTWAATFDTGSGGGDLNGSYRRPLAIISAVDPYLYAANGAIVGANPDYDPAVVRRERNVDYGTGITKAEATILAGMELARDSVTGWQGAITLKVDPREGSRHLMREGQNILLQGFRGGDVLLHISELSVDPSDDYMPVTVAVDSKARDAMSLSSVAARDRDSKADPARRPGNPARRSRQEQDMAVEYDGESGAGVIPHFPVYGGLWSVIRIPVSEVGNVKLTLAATSGPACEFSIGFFGLPLTPAHMNSLVGNPFASGAWDTNAEVMDEQYAFLESFGNETQACGYYPGGTTLTGRLKDTGSWEYISGKPPHIWVAIYATSTCFIEGRVYPAPVV